ncbi:MAG: hypothetical protein ACRDIV_23025 [Ktedonobacteraceae bacterium]
MRRNVKYICGDVQTVILIGTPQGCEETVRLLRRMSCPACQRQSRYAAASQCAKEAGLLPLHADCRQHLALAEIIRASLWRLLLPSEADEPSRQLLATLFNRHASASFWVSRRRWTLSRLTSEQVVSLVLSLL